MSPTMEQVSTTVDGGHGRLQDVRAIDGRRYYCRKCLSAAEIGAKNQFNGGEEKIGGKSRKIKGKINGDDVGRFGNFTQLWITTLITHTIYISLDS